MLVVGWLDGRATNNPRRFEQTVARGDRTELRFHNPPLPQHGMVWHKTEIPVVLVVLEGPHHDHLEERATTDDAVVESTTAAPVPPSSFPE